MCIAKEWLHCFHAKLKHTLHCTAWAPGSRTYMATCTNWANMALEQERPIWPQDGMANMANMANPSFLDGPNARQLKCPDLSTLSLREMKIGSHAMPPQHFLYPAMQCSSKCPSKSCAKYPHKRRPEILGGFSVAFSAEACS